jgi:hypothetical protein
MEAVSPSLDPTKPSRFQPLADRALAGEILDRAAARDVLAATDAELPDLLAAALRVRERRWGRRVKVCMLQNARSRACRTAVLLAVKLSTRHRHVPCTAAPAHRRSARGDRRGGGTAW